MDPGYVDAHNRLQARGLEPFLGQVISVCEGLGVARMIVNGFMEKDWDRVTELAGRHRLTPFSQIRWDRLLAETDAPSMPLPDSQSEFQLPPAVDGETINHPGNIRAVYAALSSLRKADLSDLLKICVENSNRLFGG